jgi:hypothetical protein
VIKAGTRGRLVLLACGAACAFAAPAHAATSPVRLTATLDPHARAGATTTLKLALNIDTRRVRVPVTELRVLTPRGLDITSSGLGVATCAVPPAAFAAVLLSGEPPRCSPNAVLGTGSVAARLWLSEEYAIPASGVITLFAGPPQEERPGLLAYVVAQHPVRAPLVYAGRLFEAPPPFGVGFTIAVPAIPNAPFDAVVSLTALRLTIGARDLVYVDVDARGRHTYHPDRIPITAACPAAGFVFRALVRFADGTRAVSDGRARCDRAGRGRR